jgi:hypothetical protein
MNDQGRILHLPERGVFRREIGRGLAVETEDVCSVCGTKSDEPVMCSSCSTAVHVDEAVEWLRDHPGSDHLEAATAIANRVDELGRARWPEFVARVRACACAEAPIPNDRLTSKGRAGQRAELGAER